jgi:hypothetical protein
MCRLERSPSWLAERTASVRPPSGPSPARTLRCGCSIANRLNFVRVADDSPERPVDTRAPFERGASAESALD